METSNADPIEKKICPDHRLIPVGATIFPSKTFTLGYDIALPIAEINSDREGWFSASIMGCIEYAVTASKSEIKRTFFVYGIHRRGGFFTVGKNVPLDNIVLTPGNWVGINAY